MRRWRNCDSVKNGGDDGSGGNDILVGMTAIAIVLIVEVMILEV